MRKNERWPMNEVVPDSKKGIHEHDPPFTNLFVDP